jgi:hypothetical protein
MSSPTRCDLCGFEFHGTSGSQIRCSDCLSTFNSHTDKCACGKPKRKTANVCRACHLAATKTDPRPYYIQQGQGYLKVLRPEHPRSDKNGYVLEHIVVMEEKIGRHLLPGETVHHKNGVRHDNDPDNLELWSSSHPYGQRVEDKVRWAVDLLALYAPEMLREHLCQIA